MRLLKQAMAVLGTVVVIAVIAALVTPKTAHAVIATAVQVVNMPSQPVPTLSTDINAFTIFDVTGSCTFTNFGACPIPNLYTIPASKVAVIERISGFCNMDAGQLALISVIYDGTAGITNTMYLVPGPPVPFGPGVENSFAQNLTAYALPSVENITVTFNANQGQTRPSSGCYVGVAGHLVNQ